VVLFNAAAALLVAGKAGSMNEGLTVARAAINTGQASEVLNTLRRMCPA